MLRPQYLLAHYPPPAARRRLKCTLMSIVMRIAPPKIMLKVYALTPESVKPSFKMPSTAAPRNAPMIVPEPPVSSVPPMTEDAMAMNMISVPPASGSIEPMRNVSRIPAKSSQDTTNDEIPHLYATDLDAHLSGTKGVTSGGDRV